MIQNFVKHHLKKIGGVWTMDVSCGVDGVADGVATPSTTLESTPTPKPYANSTPNPNPVHPLPTWHPFDGHPVHPKRFLQIQGPPGGDIHSQVLPQIDIIKVLRIFFCSKYRQKSVFQVQLRIV